MPLTLSSLWPIGNLALDLILDNKSGRMVCLRNGEYDNVPIEIVTSKKKVVDVDKYYDRERLRPLYKSFHQKPLFIMTSGLIGGFIDHPDVFEPAEKAQFSLDVAVDRLAVQAVRPVLQSVVMSPSTSDVDLGPAASVVFEPHRAPR